MNFKQLLEIRGTSLKKLGEAQAINVASDYPEEMARIMFREFAKAGYPIKKKSQISVINSISEALKSSMSPQNVWTSSRKDNDLRFTSEKGDDIRFTLNIVGNKAKWGFEANHVGVYPRDTSPIIISDMSASKLFQTIIKKATKILSFKSDKWDKEGIRKSREGIEKLKREPSKISVIIERIGKLYGLSAGESQDENRFYIRPSLEKYGITQYSLEKDGLTYSNLELNDSDWTNFKYSYQIKNFYKAWSKILNKIEQSNYLITRSGVYGSDEAIWFDLDIVSPNKKNPDYSDETYGEVHEISKKWINDAVKKIQVEKKTQSEVLRDIIKTVLMRNEK